MYIEYFFKKIIIVIVVVLHDTAIWMADWLTIQTNGVVKVRLGNS